MEMIPEMEKNAERIWESCLAFIKDNVNRSSYHAWFAPIKPVSLIREDGEVRLTVELPSRFFYEWLEEHYFKLLNTSVAKAAGPGARLYYKIIIARSDDHDAPGTMRLPLRPAPAPPSVAPKPVPRNEIPLPPVVSNLSSSLSFANFVEGDCNRLARSAAQAIAQDPGATSFNPFMVYGGVGLGKTHLIQAIGNRVAERFPSKRVLYVSSERFTNDFVRAIQQNKVGQFSSLYRSIDVLIIDDVQFLTNKEKTQEEFFHVFNELHQLGKQIILSADRPPKDINGIEERLLSRFQWGLTADLQVPELETRMAILQLKAVKEGVELPRDVTTFVARHIKSNIRELEGALVRLITHATLLDEELNPTMAKNALKDLVHTRPANLSIDHIQQIVSEYFEIATDQIRAKTRKREVVQARQLAMFFSRELTQNSLKTIGLQFGGRDHSTVLHANRSVTNQIETNPQYREMVQHLRTSLISHAP